MTHESTRCYIEFAIIFDNFTLNNIFDLKKIISTKNATIGISIKGIEDQDTLSINGNLDAPMMSLFKFPIALTALNLVDKGIFLLTQYL